MDTPRRYSAALGAGSSRFWSDEFVETSDGSLAVDRDVIPARSRPRNPKVIERDSLASEALELLNSLNITALIVTEANRPVGIVHLHDLLRAGVA